jgi:1-deoxy-D-xylulose-5-phosphate reductoisomerase
MDLDLVLNGITGAAGLRASLATLEAGIDLALANKESLVTAGVLLRSAAEKSGARIIPVDSEHGAIRQCITGSNRDSIHRIILTASGGPFRGMTRDQLATVTPAEALQHPTWKMGPRISIDSATLFNKLLEVVEAQELFGMPRGGIEVVIHPQSIVHAIVEFQDGSSIAHLGEPDMKVPIRDALHRGQRAPGRFQPLDLIGHGELSFEAIDGATFPAMEIGKVVLDNPGTTLGAVLNAADEEAVAAFLSGSVGFLQIYELVERALGEHQPHRVENLEQVIEADHITREQVRSWNP